jgi:hypothetical protein
VLFSCQLAFPSQHLKVHLGITAGCFPSFVLKHLNFQFLKPQDSCKLLPEKNKSVWYNLNSRGRHWVSLKVSLAYYLNSIFVDSDNTLSWQHMLSKLSYLLFPQENHFK